MGSETRVTSLRKFARSITNSTRKGKEKYLLGMESVPNMMKAITRVAQPKPIRGWREWKTIGYMIPPC